MLKSQVAANIVAEVMLKRITGLAFQIEVYKKSFGT
jgi:hypothetical protein